MSQRISPMIHSARVFIVCLVLTSAVGAASERVATSLEKIETAFDAGSIDRQEMLVEQAMAFFAPQDLSAKFKSESPGFIKSGTGLVMQIQDDWDLFTPEQQQQLESYINRPAMQRDTDSPSGHFKIHYDTSGYEAVPPQDDNGNSIPDYVERLGEYLDSSRTTFLDYLGYLSPPIDTAGGDSKYDVYLLSIQGYGYTAPDYPGDSVWNDYASYIGIHCRMDFNIYPNDDPEGDVIGAQKVTAAHEYFHAVQLAYRYDYTDYLWLMEATSTWMEEVVFPVVNDNYNYLPDFLSYPYLSLISTQAYHEYGDFIWAAFLHQRYDIDIIRKIWEAARYNLSLPAHDSGLAAYGTTLGRAFSEFTVWNYFTGSRAIPGKYYEDAAAFPQVPLDQSYATLVHGSVTPVTSPGGLACNYIEFTIDATAFGMLEMMLDGNNTTRWALSGVILDETSDTSHSVVSILNENLYIWHLFIDDYLKVVAIPANISRYTSTNTYVLSTVVLPYGDANHDVAINVADATYLVNYIFRGGPLPVPFSESGDANCDGLLNIADAVRIVNYVFQGGDAPCFDH